MSAANCSIQRLNFAITFIKKKIHIKNLDQGQENEDFELCQGPGHFSVDIKSVVSLDLSRCELCELPDCLKTLPLKLLNISYNSISAVPECILNGLPFIEELYFNNNSLREFNIEPACVLRLRILDISENSLRHIPPWLLNVKSINLRELVYSKNMVGCTDSSLYHKIAAYSLEKLVLHSSHVANKNITFLKSIRRLKYLDLSNSKIQINQNCISYYDEIFDKPAWSDTLQALNLNRLYVSFLPENISKITNLKEVRLTYNDLYWLPESFGELKSLEILDLSNNLLCNLPKSFPKLQRLKILKLQFNQLSRVEEIYQLKDLKVLDLYSNELDEFKGELKNFIDLEHNNLITVDFPLSYHERRTSYRKENNFHDRIVGQRNDFYVPDTRSEYSSSFMSDDIYYCSDMEHSYEPEENWDVVVKEKSHPDITYSDDEWDGCFRIYKFKESKVAPKVKDVVGVDLYELYRDAEE